MTDTSSNSVYGLRGDASQLINKSSWDNHDAPTFDQRPALSVLHSSVLPRRSLNKPRKPPRLTWIKPTLSAHAIKCGYDNTETPAISIDHLEFPNGSKTAVLGSFGAGKTTLLKLLTGAHTPCEGVVEIGGIPLQILRKFGGATGIGYIPQKIRLNSGTLREILLPYGMSRSDELLSEALEFAECGHLLAERAGGLDQPLENNEWQLTESEVQLIGLARLWLEDPEIVILDEPFSEVGQSTIAKLREKLIDWCHPKTLILATDQKPLLRLATTAIILSKGRLVAAGNIDLVTAALSSAKLRYAND